MFRGFPLYVRKLRYRPQAVKSVAYIVFAVQSHEFRADPILGGASPTPYLLADMDTLFSNPREWGPRLSWTIAIVVVTIVLRFVVVMLVRRRVDDPEIWYRTQKLLTYGGTMVAPSCPT